MSPQRPAPTFRRVHADMDCLLALALPLSVVRCQPRTPCPLPLARSLRRQESSPHRKSWLLATHRLRRTACARIALERDDLVFGSGRWPFLMSPSMVSISALTEYLRPLSSQKNSTSFTPSTYLITQRINLGIRFSVQPALLCFHCIPRPARHTLCRGVRSAFRLHL